MRWSKHILLLLVVTIFLVAACTKIPPSGTLKGKVTIGPLCPVERNPPDPSCQPTEETYRAWALAVVEAQSKKEVVVIIPQLDGTFSVQLPPGDYMVDLQKSNNAIGKGGGLPLSVTINDGHTTTASINIDTGIR